MYVTLPLTGPAGGRRAVTPPTAPGWRSSRRVERPALSRSRRVPRRRQGRRLGSGSGRRQRPQRGPGLERGRLHRRARLRAHPGLGADHQRRGLVQISPDGRRGRPHPLRRGLAESPDRYQPSGSPTFARIVPADDVVAGAADWLEPGATGELATGALRGLWASSRRRRGSRRQVLAARRSTRSPARAQTRTGFRTDLAARPGPPGRLRRVPQRFGREPGPYAAYGYEAMALALQAIGAANTNSDQFRERGPRRGVRRRAARVGARRLLDHRRGRLDRLHDPALSGQRRAAAARRSPLPAKLSARALRRCEGVPLGATRLMGEERPVCQMSDRRAAELRLARDHRGDPPAHLG